VIDIKNVVLITDNNQSVYATFVTPKQNAKATVIIAPALGLDKIYYQNFALWLANQGFMAVTFDYSSMNESNREEYKSSATTITDWAMFDCKKVIEQTLKEHTSQDIYWIGHSLGGQITGMIPNIDSVSKIITIASGSGYWLQNAAPLKKKAWLLWYFIAPVLLKTLGYFPGKRLGMVGNLPFGVMKQWRKWCLHPQYLFGIENQSIKEAYQEFDKPMTSISFTDDQLMSAENINSLHSFFGSDISMHRISPEQINVKSIGHFGFFNEKFKAALWETHLLPELTFER
jgi:predicted alpha/beta hydrolase